jgi:RNA polymerase sigma-70 factor, ECF subfamily
MTVPWTGDVTMEQSLLRQLIRAAKGGDNAAFERIVILNERMVLRVARRLLMDSEDAKDAAQEVLIRLHRNLNRFDDDQELGPWLYRMTVNICRDLIRRTRRNLSLDVAMKFPAKDCGPEQSAALTEQYELVLAGLDVLTHREREVMVLRDLEGCSTDEVAQILNSSEATVRSQLSTGRVKMRRFLAGRLGKSI